MPDPLALLIIAVALVAIFTGMTWLAMRATRSVAALPDVRAVLVRLPQVGFSLWGMFFLLGVSIDPNSHTMWPMKLVQVLALWLAWIVLVAVVLAALRLLRRDGR